ncbi:hypothetical protein GCM10011386_47970 [Parapedobacter defluvii]|uniref:WD40-like Beta Propeller Repeat n=1 Tax=Parapedobacter defluvii TaxID=2045106 RepID=A0ABQ1MZP5_9SPHI|nr:hypothetical protein GCM10011386_47970 [Parapedobacter defluvii]
MVIVGLFVLLVENRRLKPIGILLFNLVIVASILLHAEAVFTYRFTDYIIEDLYNVKHNYYFNKPYLDKTFRDKEFLVQYKTNKQGFRIGAEDDPETEVGAADWLFIGDSYTQGAQVQYEELYTSKLFDYFPNKIIVNAGISGLGIIDEYYYYIHEGSKLGAKKVFLQICNFNDFMNVDKRQFGFSDYLMQHSNFARFVLYGFKYANPAELPLGRWTEPFYPDEKSNRNFNVFYQEQSEKKQRDLKNFKLYFEKLAEKVKADGAELVVIQIPTKEQVYYKYLDEVITNFNIDASKLDLDFPNRLMAELCDANQVKHLDLLSDFTDTGSHLFFQFDEHLNVAGHDRIAQSLANMEFASNDQAYGVPSLISKLNVGDRYPVFVGGDNNSLTYQSFRDGNMELFIADSLFENIRRLTWNSVDEIHPWTSPDGTQLVCTEGNQSANNTKVVLMNIDGSNRRYITNQENVFGAIPAFDFQGNRIAYAEWVQAKNSGYLSNPRIVIYDLRTGEKSYITTDDYESWRPIFSPDSQKLYFISKEVDNQFDVFEYTLSDGIKKNITNSPYDEWDPAISKDGRKLIYAGKQHGNWDLFLLELGTSKSYPLTRSLGNEWDPTFSPSGKYVYYAATYGLRNGIFKISLKD